MLEKTFRNKTVLPLDNEFQSFFRFLHRSIKILYSSAV